MEHLHIGTFSELMHHFEAYHEFKPEAKPILEMYEAVCKAVFRKARFGISDDESRIEAAIWKASADTLEALLSLYLVDEPDEEIDLSDIKSFAMEFSQTLSKEK
jgi:hypothetical protein